MNNQKCLLWLILTNVYLDTHGYHLVFQQLQVFSIELWTIIILQGIPSVLVYLDDILITEPTVNEHLQSLEIVLDRLAKAGLHIKGAVHRYGSHAIKMISLAVK